MLSKTVSRATLLVAIACLFCCRTSRPWQNEKPASAEINLAFVFQNNLPYLASVTIDGREGQYLFGSAHPRSLAAPAAFPAAGPNHRLGLNLRENMVVEMVSAELGGVADAIIGGGTFREMAVTIDYHAGLLTIQRDGIHTDQMVVHRFAGPPAVPILVDDRQVLAIIDTAIPDTLILPASGTSERGAARVSVGGVDFGTVDVRYGAVEQARLGNRLLSKFLVTIDYRGGRVALWRDPRTPLN